MIRYEHLLGRPFEWGVNDCRTLAESFYKDNFNLGFPKFALPNDWDNGKPAITVNEIIYRGFELIDYNPFKSRLADLYVSAFFSDYPNHLMVYVGEGKVIHHVEGGLSKVSVFKGMLKTNLCAVFRYPNLNLDEDAVSMKPILDDAPYHVRRAFDAQ